MLCIYAHMVHCNVAGITSERWNALIFVARPVEKVTDLSLSFPGHLSHEILDLESVTPKPRGS